MTITLNALQKQRRDTASNWTSNNTVLLAGEIGYESDTKKFKIGDGSTAWQSLDYLPIPDTNRLLTGNLTVGGNFTVNGTTTTIDTTTLTVEDKNIEIGKVSTPTDTTADGGGITLKGATDKTINWVDSTDSWTLSEHLDLANGKVYKINNTEILSATTLGSSVVSSSLTSVGTIATGVWNATAISGSKVTPDFGSQNIITTGGLTVDTTTFHVDSSNNRVGIGTTSPQVLMHLNATNARFQLTDSTTGTGSSDGVILGLNGSQDFFINNRESSKNLLFFTNNTERMRIDSSGNIGIGTLSPSALLHTNLAAENGSIAQFGLSGQTNNQSFIIKADDSDSLFTFRFGSSNSTYPAVRFNMGADAEAMRITNDQKVGIGTTSPSALLDVNGQARFGGNKVTLDTDGSITQKISNSTTRAFMLSNTDVSADFFGGRVYQIWSDGTVMIGGSAGTNPASYSTPKIQLNPAGNSFFNVSGGNFGIGTTSPLAPLHAKNATNNTIARLESGDATSRLQLKDNSGEAFVAATGDDLIFSNTSSITERMRIDSSGKVMIGTTSLSPANSYSNNLVVSEASGDAGISIHGNNSNSNYASFYLGDAGAASRAYLEAQLGSGTSTNFTIGAQGATRFLNNGAERMRIDSAGRVGIGTTSPAVNIHSHTGNATNYQAFTNTACGGSTGSDGLLLGIDSNANVNIFNFENTYMNFGTNGSERMRITSDGKVGINTTNPATLLQLVGSSSSTASSGGTLGIRQKGDTNNDGITISSSHANSGRIYKDTNGALHIYNTGGNSNDFIITNSGNVGLGTDSIMGQLHIGSGTGGGNVPSNHEILFGANNSDITFLSANDSASVDGTIGAWNTVYNFQASKIVFDKNAANTGQLLFFTQNGTGITERTRITSDGHLLVGTTTDNVNSSTFGISLEANGSGHFFRNVDGGFSAFRAGGNQGLAIIRGDGDLFNTNNSYGQVSDETLKQDIVDAASQWNDIKNLKVRKFRFKDNPTGVLQIGVIAQEIEKVSAGLVQEDNEGIKSVKYSVLYMKAIKCLQEAITKIETLETKVAALEAA